ncbi:hypothetical protein TNCV_3513981 [Trichonephila clavipes]|nr:hypothetical protein TNCV_3513981 [Trichonephila clavipes]
MSDLVDGARFLLGKNSIIREMTMQEELCPEKRNAIEELKRRTINDITPKMREDETLFYRFLKARQFNVENAESMLRKDLAQVPHPPHHMLSYPHHRLLNL